MSSATNQQSSTKVLPIKLPGGDSPRAEAPPALSANDATNYEVVIVGAGMAGLAAAYHTLLKRPATKLVIVESKDRVGGRIHSIPVNGKTIDLGAKYGISEY
jgi:monoamine oxidase